MFRIKNVRNATVAKQANLSPSLPRNIQPLPKPKHSINPPRRQPPGKIVVPQPREPKIAAQKVVIPKGKVHLVSKAHAEDLGQCKKMEISGLHHPKLTITHAAKDRHNIAPRQEISALKSVREEKAAEKGNGGQDKKEGALGSAEEQKFIKFVREQEEAKKKEEEREQERKAQQQQENRRKEKQEEQEKRQRQARQKKEREQVDKKRKQAEEAETRRREEKQRQRAEEIKREEQLTAMMEKVQARRKAREEEKRRRKQRQESLKVQEHGQGIGGMVSLSDPLAHIQMSQAIMDRQIQNLLKMKFANFPNQTAIEAQLQELQRINQSFMMVREDPNNSLIRGLGNLRIQLFNRVGELVVAGKAEMGQSASGMRMVQADALRNGGVEGVRVTRGLEGQVERLVKIKEVTEEGECPICLVSMEKGEEVYRVNCGHEFHKECLQNWLAGTANCPACRYNIKMDHP